MHTQREDQLLQDVFSEVPDGCVGADYWSSLLRGMANRNPASQILQPIASELHSNAAFILRATGDESERWSIPDGWIYSINGFDHGFGLRSSDRVLRDTLHLGALAIHGNDADRSKYRLNGSSVKSLLAACIGQGACQGVLVVCNSSRKKHSGKALLSYTMADMDVAIVSAAVLAKRGLTEAIGCGEGKLKMETSSETSNVLTWKEERAGLLRQYRGWIAAYQDGHRVAISPNLAALGQEIERKLGPKRRPCELFRIDLETETQHGPSPRLAPGDADWHVETREDSE